MVFVVLWYMRNIKTEIWFTAQLLLLVACKGRVWWICQIKAKIKSVVIQWRLLIANIWVIWLIEIEIGRVWLIYSKIKSIIRLLLFFTRWMWIWKIGVEDISVILLLLPIIWVNLIWMIEFNIIYIIRLLLLIIEIVWVWEIEIKFVSLLLLLIVDSSWSIEAEIKSAI